MSGRTSLTPWSEFVGWCRARGLRPLPAHPWTVAAYARWCERRHRYPLIVARIRALARVHLLKCASFPDRHPTVLRTLRLIEARDRARACRSDLFMLNERPAAARGDATSRPTAAAGRERRRPGGMLRLTPRLVARRPQNL